MPGLLMDQLTNSPKRRSERVRRGEPVARPNRPEGKRRSHTGENHAAHSVRVSHRLTPTGNRNAHWLRRTSQLGYALAPLLLISDNV